MGGGIRPAKARGPWVGPSGVGDGFTAGINNSSSEFIDVFIGSDGKGQFNVDHTLQSDFRYKQAFWASTLVEKSGDWTFSTGTGWVGASMVNATTWFQKRVRDEFDMQIKASQAGSTANPIGFQASGAGQTAKMTIEYDGVGLTHRIRTEFTGQSDVLTVISGTSQHLRIRRNQQNQIQFFHRQGSSVVWTKIAQYSCDLEDNVELAFVTSTSNTISELAYKVSRWAENRVYTLTDAATIAVDVSRADKFQVTLGGNRTLGNPTNPVNDGQLVVFRIVQDGTGGRTLAFGANYRFTDGATPVVASAANDVTYLGFVYNEDDAKWDYVHLDPQPIRALAPSVAALTDAATIAVDASTANFFKVTLGGNRTLGAPSNPLGDGQKIMIRVTQDGTGSRTLAYNAIYRFSTDLPSPTLSTGAGDIDYLGFIYHSTDNKWDFIGKVFGF